MNAELPPGFERDVWRGIDSRAQEKLSLIDRMQRWISVRLPRPTLAISYITALTIVGVSAGFGHARQESARLKGELSNRYVQVLDPYLPAK